MTIMQDIQRELLGGTREQINFLLRTELNTPDRADAIVRDALLPVAHQVAQRYEEGKFLIPDLVVTACLLLDSLELLEPVLGRGRARNEANHIFQVLTGDSRKLSLCFILASMANREFLQGECAQLGKEPTKLKPLGYKFSRIRKPSRKRKQVGKSPKARFQRINETKQSDS